MILHAYLYQKYDKGTTTNGQFLPFVVTFGIYLLISEVIYRMASFYSKHLTQIHILLFFGYVDTRFNDPRYYSQPDQYDVLFSYYIPLLQFILGAIILWPFQIEGYFKQFVFLKYTVLLYFSVKTILFYNTLGIFTEIFRIVETYFLTSLFIIVLTDPVSNENGCEYSVGFNEIYLRIIEHISILQAYNLIRSYDSIDYCKERRIINESSVTGKHDSLRGVIICLAISYYFVLINSFAYSFKYAYGFTTAILIFPITYWLMHSQSTKASIAVQVLFLASLVIHFWAFLNTFPNEGPYCKGNKTPQYFPIMNHTVNNEL